MNIRNDKNNTTINNNNNNNINHRMKSTPNSTELKRRRPRIKKKSKSHNNDDDVQVFTSLPPKVDGSLRSYLRFQINKINLIENNNKLTVATTNYAAVRVLWWGEDGTGSIFRPKIIVNNNKFDNTNRSIQSTARYSVKSGPKQLTAYLTDMGALEIDLVDEKTMNVMGKAQINEINQLTFLNPIKNTYSIYNENKNKIAEVFLNIKLEALNDQNSELSGFTSDTGTDYSRSNSLINTNRNQMTKIDDYVNKNQYFVNNSNTLTTATTDSNNGAGGPIGTSLITTLLDKGKKLKEEMIKSTLNTKTHTMPTSFDTLLLPTTTSTSVSTAAARTIASTSTINPFNNYNDSNSRKFIADDNINSRIINLLVDNQKSSVINESIIANELNLTPNYEYDSNDSDLNDPLHDANIINNLFYSNYDAVDDAQDIDRFTQRRSNLAHQAFHKSRSRSRSPKNKKIRKKSDESVSSSHSRSSSRGATHHQLPPLSNKQSLIKTSSPLVSHTKPSLTSLRKKKRDLNQSGNDSDQSDQSRVSFDMQHSDHEQSFDSTSHHQGHNSNTLSVERLNLLGQIQVAKVNIEKIYLILNMQSIIDSLNSKTSLSVEKSSGKPPKSSLSNKQIAYFIEYQFPVVASSRDQIGNATMATEVMRVASKRVDFVNNEIHFTHSATFPVLFNGNSLELWWKTILVFKIYARLPTMKAPLLIGASNVALKDLLKAENLKFEKKLRLIDSSNMQQKATNKQSSLSIGSIDCKLELSSNTRDFDEQLMKLRIYEANNPKNIPIVATANSNNNNNSSKLILASTTGTSTKTNSNSKSSTNTNINETINSSSQTAIQFYLEINEGRNFIFENSIATQLQTQTKQQQQQQQNVEIDAKNLYLISRLFWCDEKLKSEICWGINKQQYGNDRLIKFNLKESLTFFLNKNILERMHNNYMIVEVWNKRLKAQQTDNLIGIVKLPLNQFYIQFKDDRLIKLFYIKSKQPSIGCDTWMPVIDPFSGQKTGELNILLAMGSTDQIFNLQNYKLDLIEINENNNNNSSVVAKAEKFQNEHLFEVKIDSINNLKFFDNMVWGETDCYVQYYFPTQTNGVLSMKSYRTQTTLCIPNLSFNEILKHSIKTSMNLFNIQKELLFAFGNSGGGGGGGGGNTLNYNLQFEIWLRYYYPNVRDQIVARGELPLNKLCAMLSMNDAAENLLKHQSFKIKLYSITNHQVSSSSSSSSLVTTKSSSSPLLECGELGIQINYKINTIKSNNNNNHHHVHNELTLSQICINVGIIRACGLKACAKYLKNTEPKLQYASEIGLNVYVKVHLEILNESFSLMNQIDVGKQTRTIARSFIPEYFHYFDFLCPIIWTNEESETISLAELLDNNCLELKFELWHQVPRNETTGSSGDVDVLIGTTNVKLKQLLYKQTGIKGWLPVQSPIIGWKMKKYSSNEHNGLPNPLNYINGGLEINIRFGQQDDRSRILDAAKQIGFNRYNDYQYLFNSLTLNDDSFEKCYLFHVSVEQIQIPLSLGIRHGEKEIHSTTKCYLRYKLFDSEPVLTKCKLIEKSINDVDLLKCTFKFSKQHVFNKSAQLLWYLNEEQLEIQLWLTNDTEEFKTKPSEKDRLVGSAFVNMDSFNMDNLATAKSIKTKKFYRINGLYPLYKLAHTDLSGSFCEINLTLEKLNDITDTTHTSLFDGTRTFELYGDDSSSLATTNSFACIIGIERASHLPLVHDRLLNRHVDPNAYVTYSSAKTKHLSFTNIVEHTINPVWNYQETTLFSADHLFDESKCLILKVWHKINLDLEQQTPEKSGDKVIGFVSIDLSPLMSGLQQISGWYNIIDLVGQCQGQLKVNICPQQNLFEFKRSFLSTKPKATTSSQHESFFNNNKIEKHLSSIRMHHEYLRNNNSSDQNSSDSCLKTNLRKQLDDLDKINEKLKEKLRFSNSPSTTTASTIESLTNNSTASSNVVVVPTVSISRKSHEQQQQQQTPIVESNIQRYIDEHTRQLLNAQEVLKKANNLINLNLNNSNNEVEYLEISNKLSNSSQNTLIDSKNDKLSVESLPPKPSPKINKNDSFWSTPSSSPNSSLSQKSRSSRSSTPIENEKILEKNSKFEYFNFQNKEEQGNVDNSEEIEKKIVTFDNKLDKYDEEEPVKIDCVNDDEESEEKDEEEKDDYDTDLDQTNNLSSQYLHNNNNIDEDNENFDIIDIKPLNSVSGVNFDFYSINETNNNDFTKITNISAANNSTVTNEKAMNALNEIGENEEDNDENYEFSLKNNKKTSQMNDMNDLVIIGSKIFNKSETTTPFEAYVSKTKIDNHEEKELPNYFLPPKDLEKSMRELHFTYKQTNGSQSSSTAVTQNNNRIDELVNRIKSKSPAILNETTNNLENSNNAKFKGDSKDLDRLNKIFRAKYNQ